MVKLALRPSHPFLTFPSMWEDEDFSHMIGGNGLEVYETENEVVIKAPVPGIKAENLDITVEDGVLRITGKSEEKEEEKNAKKVVYQSQRITSFNYSTTLPRAVDTSKIEAEIEDGVLVLKAPLSSEAKPRKITVKGK